MLILARQRPYSASYGLNPHIYPSVFGNRPLVTERLSDLFSLLDTAFSHLTSRTMVYQAANLGLTISKPQLLKGVEAVITNPPYKLAVEFAEKALEEVPYLALLLRTNFLESTSRLSFFRKHQPARIWISSRRLPMMHRHGWQGPRAPSNTCFAWFIWDRISEQKRVIDWFDWKHIPARHETRDLFDFSKEQLRAVA